MSLSKQQKVKIINELIDKLDRMKTAVFVDYRGISTKEMQKLKKKLEEENINFKIVKKTLLKIALQKSGLKNISVNDIDAPIAVIFGFDDEIKPSRIVFQFTKEQKHLKILGGVLENKRIDAETVKTLALLPTREELLGKLTNLLSAPLGNLVNVLRGDTQKLVCILRNVKNAKTSVT